MRAAVDRAVPARLLADPNAVRDFGGDGAADRAMGADALADGRPARRAPAAARPCALRTLPSGRAPSAARPPAARPERRKKLRRSRPRSDWLGKAASAPRRASRSVLLISTARLPQFRIAVDAVVGLHLVAFAIARLALLVVCFAVGCCFVPRQRRHGARRCAGAEQPEEIAATDGRLVLRLRFIGVLPSARFLIHGSANASVSISMKRRPIAPTGR